MATFFWSSKTQKQAGYRSFTRVRHTIFTLPDKNQIVSILISVFSIFSSAPSSVLASVLVDCSFATGTYRRGITELLAFVRTADHKCRYKLNYFPYVGKIQSMCMTVDQISFKSVHYSFKTALLVYFDILLGFVFCQSPYMLLLRLCKKILKKKEHFFTSNYHLKRDKVSISYLPSVLINSLYA